MLVLEKFYDDKFPEHSPNKIKKKSRVQGVYECMGFTNSQIILICNHVFHIFFRDSEFLAVSLMIPEFSIQESVVIHPDPNKEVESCFDNQKGGYWII